MFTIGKKIYLNILNGFRYFIEWLNLLFFRIYVGSLTRDETTRLVTAAKSHETTVQGVLQAAAVAAQIDLLKEKGGLINTCIATSGRVGKKLLDLMTP